MMRIETAIRRLMENYQDAKGNELIRDKVAWSLHQTWVEAEELQKKHKCGGWIKEDYMLTSNPPKYKWHCSVCGYEVIGFSPEILTDFCPGCNADMRGLG